MLDALLSRLAELESVGERALPAAARAIATKLRGDVKRSQRAQAKRRTAKRAELAVTHGKKAARLLVPTRGRHGSGISIDGVATEDSVIVRASNEVHFIGRRQDEPEEWMQLFGDAVRAAAKGGG